MKKAVFFILIVSGLVAPVSLRAQSLTFCRDVDTNGMPINPSGYFRMINDACYVNFLVKLEQGTDSEFISYDIYFVSASGKESYDNTVRQPVKVGWTWFSKDYVFQFPGTYHVYVRDDKMKTICSGKLSVSR